MWQSLFWLIFLRGRISVSWQRWRLAWWYRSSMLLTFLPIIPPMLPISVLPIIIAPSPLWFIFLILLPIFIIRIRVIMRVTIFLPSITSASPSMIFTLILSIISWRSSSLTRLIMPITPFIRCLVLLLDLFNLVLILSNSNSFLWLISKSPYLFQLFLGIFYLFHLPLFLIKLLPY